MVTLNKSPSKYNSNCPFCISVNVFAMDKPSPLPSVLRDISPLINRSVNSSADIFSGYADTFFSVNRT